MAVPGSILEAPGLDFGGPQLKLGGPRLDFGGPGPRFWRVLGLEFNCDPWALFGAVLSVTFEKVLMKKLKLKLSHEG